MLAETPVQWLLGAQTPSIRYLTLRQLLGRPTDDAEVQIAWQEMKTAAPIPAILAEQTDKGSWSGERSYYTPKYTSTHWSLLLLAELSADANEPRLKRGTEYMLSVTQRELEHSLQTGDYGWSCFWGNLLRYALHNGFAEDARLEAVVRHLIHDALAAGWRCEYNGETPCAWGAARALWGLAALPTPLRPSQWEKAIQSGLTFLLEDYDLVQANYPTRSRGKVSPHWFRPNFPLFYQADILFVLRVLAELDALKHPGVQAALAWLESLRRADGTWRGTSPYRRRTWSSLTDSQETDRWVTLHATWVLSRVS